VGAEDGWTSTCVLTVTSSPNGPDAPQLRSRTLIVHDPAVA